MPEVSLQENRLGRVKITPVSSAEIVVAASLREGETYPVVGRNGLWPRRSANGRLVKQNDTVRDSGSSLH